MNEERQWRDEEEGKENYMYMKKSDEPTNRRTNSMN